MPQTMLGTAPGNPILLNFHNFLSKLSTDLTCFLNSSCSIRFDCRDLPMRSDINPVLQIANLGHSMVAFVNGEYIGNYMNRGKQMFVL